MSCTNPSWHYVIEFLTGDKAGKRKALFSMNGYDLPSLPLTSESLEEQSYKLMNIRENTLGRIFRNDKLDVLYQVQQVVKLPCGRCRACQKTRSLNWVARLIIEYKDFKKTHKPSFMYFITLTYNDDELPLSKKTGIATLDKQEVRRVLNLIKNEEHLKSCDFRYFLCGEYGNLTMRPHYHAIVYSSKDIDWSHYWSHGFISVDDVSADSIAYTTRYVDKKLNDNIKTKDFELLGIEPIFNLVSHNLGSSFEEQFLEDLPLSVLGFDGKEYSVPRYFTKKLEDDKKEEYLAKLTDSLTNKFLSYKLDIANQTEEQYLNEQESKLSRQKTALKRDL